MASSNTITVGTEEIERVPGIFANQLAEASEGLFSQIQTARAVRNKFSMTEGSTDDTIFQPYAAKLTATGSSTITETNFSIFNYGIKHEIEFSEFDNTKWKIDDIKNEDLPAEVKDFLASQYGKRAANLVQKGLFTGNGGLTGDLSTNVPDGWPVRIKAALTAASLTNRIITDATNDPTSSADILTVLDLMIAQASDAMLDNSENFGFIIPKRCHRAYKAALKAQLATNFTNTPEMYEDFKMDAYQNCNSRRIILGDISKLGAGFDFSGEALQLDFINQYPINGDNLSLAVGKFGYGAGSVTTDFVIFEYTA